MTRQRVVIVFIINFYLFEHALIFLASLPFSFHRFRRTDERKFNYLRVLPVSSYSFSYYDSVGKCDGQHWRQSKIGSSVFLPFFFFNFVGFGSFVVHGGGRDDRFMTNEMSKMHFEKEAQVKLSKHFDFFANFRRILSKSTSGRWKRKKKTSKTKWNSWRMRLRRWNFSMKMRFCSSTILLRRHVRKWKMNISTKIESDMSQRRRRRRRKKTFKLTSNSVVLLVCCCCRYRVGHPLLFALYFSFYCSKVFFVHVHTFRSHRFGSCSRQFKKTRNVWNDSLKFLFSFFPLFTTRHSILDRFCIWCICWIPLCQWFSAVSSVIVDHVFSIFCLKFFVVFSSLVLFASLSLDSIKFLILWLSATQHKVQLKICNSFSVQMNVIQVRLPKCTRKRA